MPRSPSVALTGDTAAVPPHHPDAHVGQQRGGADHRDRQRRDQDVVVADVAELVGDDALELDPVHLLEQSGRDGDRGVLRIAAGRERVRRRVVDHVHARLGEPAGDAQPLDDVVQPGVLLRVGGVGAADGERDLVGLPVRREGDDGTDHEGDDRGRDPVAEDEAEGEPDQRHDHHEGDDEQHAAALVRSDEVVHVVGVWSVVVSGQAAARQRRRPGGRRLRTRRQASRVPPRRSRSTHAART